MLRLTLSFLLLVISIVSIGQNKSFNYQRDFKSILTQTNDPNSAFYFETLLHRFQNNDTSLSDSDILALLIGFTDNESFKPYDYLIIERRVFKLNHEGKFALAISLADSLLKSVPLSQQSLIEKSYAFHKLDQKDSSDYYMWKFQKIMQAMASTGDGLTPEHAIFSLGPADGQNFILHYLKGHIGTMGSGRDKNGNFVDILTMLPKSENKGESGTPLYFQIQHAVDKMFDHEEVESVLKGKKTKKKEKLKVNKKGKVYIKN